MVVVGRLVVWSPPLNSRIMATSLQVDSDTHADAVSKQISGYDENSGIWLEEFSLLLNYMFPVERIFHQWYAYLEMNELRKMEGKSLHSASGSIVEGFNIPCSGMMKDKDNRNLFQPDVDSMWMIPHFFQSGITGIDHPIFAVEHALDDPRYVKLQITREYRCELHQFKNVEFLNHAYLFDSNAFSGSEKEAIQHNLSMKSMLRGPLMKEFNDVQQQDKFIYEAHGPVYREYKSGLAPHQRDVSMVFTYPNAWPEKAMEWLSRTRLHNWPSPDLIQEICKSGCHIAPVGRGQRSRDPMDRKDYIRNPEAAVADTKAEMGMDETEWRMSFSIAENKLAASVSPIQRHVMVLLKMLKKMYFSDISTYLLKNLAFWEYERKGGSFWNDNNTAVCLLFMLDQLIQYLKEGFLPHYIMPESNLLEGEDPTLLKKVAQRIVKIRRNILQRTFSMLKKALFDSSVIFYAREFDIEDIVLKVKNKNLEGEERLALKMKICNTLVNLNKTLISTAHLISNSKESIHMHVETEISKAIYQSVVSRLFCKIYNLNPHQRSLEDIVVNGTHQLPNSKEIMAQSKEYLHGMANGNDLSTLVPTSASMIDVRKNAAVNTWSLQLSLYIVFEYKPIPLQINDYLEIVKDFVENNRYLKRRFRGLEKVKLIVVTMIYIEGLLKEIQK